MEIMILVKSEFWRFGLHFFIIVFTKINFGDGICTFLCVVIWNMLLWISLIFDCVNNWERECIEIRNTIWID